jgi:hypothetical protein
MRVHFIHMEGGYHHIAAADMDAPPRQGETIALCYLCRGTTRYSEFAVREVITQVAPEVSAYVICVQLRKDSTAGMRIQAIKAATEPQ